MSPYRDPPAARPGMEEPPAGSPWWEVLAWQVLLAHQPAPAQRVTALPGFGDADLVRTAAKHARPRCRRCRRDVEKLAIITSANEPAVDLLIECHGEQTTKTIQRRALRLALAQGFPQLGAFLLEELRAEVFDAEARRYERFDDPRDGHAEGFDEAEVCHGRGGVDRLVAAVMVKTED